MQSPQQRPAPRTPPRAQPREWVIDRPDEFLVATDAYRDDAVFAAEMEHIFHSSWVYLGHESEIDKPGDYKATYIGLQPVVVARDLAGKINAFMNFCTHRGAALVREEYGNSKALTCAYHGWTFKLSGELAGVPDRVRYPASFSTADKGLIPVAQVASYGGLMFGSLKPAIPLEQHLGEARRQIDLLLARTAGSRYKVGRPHRYKYRGNWKFQAENVVDGYHPMAVHRSALNTLKKMDMLGNRATEEVLQGGKTMGFPQGHGLLGAPAVRDLVFISSAKQDEYKQRLAQLHGAQNVEEIMANQHLVIFPSVALMDLNIRVIQPIAPDVTEVYSYPLSIEGETDEHNAARLHELQLRLGTAGMVQTDDIDIFARNQVGLRVQSARHLVLSRGMESEKVLETGVRIGEYSDETPQRAFWRQWQKVMGAAEVAE